jgi:signal transduction histidine kinase
VEEERTGGGALNRLRRQPFDLVLLDYHLPDLTGEQFVDELSRIEPAVSVPVAVLTGEENNEIAARVLSRGAIDYLVKGTVTPAGFARVIENSIEKHAVHRELLEKRAALELRNWELETLREEMQTRLEELAEAHNTKDQFLAVMSHEMRTPLNAILGYADLLEIGIGGELTEAQRTNVARIRLGGRHLLDLINDVLDLARADASKLELDIRPVDLHAALEEVVALLESQASATGLQLKVVACEEEELMVQVDLQRLRQILMNLIGNAIKFTEDGQVTVECESSDGQILVRVRDTGIGISPEMLPQIFSEFVQVEGSLTRARGGSGLGLAIALRLARLMGGDVRAESELGSGSTFTLVLPRAATGSTPRDTDAVEQAARTERMREYDDPAVQRLPVATVVAFGEDSEALAGLANHVAADLNIAWTTDPAEVAEMAREESAVLVVLDISSGRDAAWRAAHSVQEVPELAHTAVLLLPSIPRVDPTQSDGIDLGWVSLVPKPFTGEQLTRAVLTAHSSGSDAPSPPGEIVCKVLVVDDDEDSRRVAARFLTEAGASVRESADGESALNIMRRARPDVVVLDLMMPVLDGFGVLATMRADPALEKIPVVVLSAKTLTPAEREFLSRTAIRVLQKGEHRLGDVASLVMRAAVGAGGGGASAVAGTESGSA